MSNEGVFDVLFIDVLQKVQLAINKSNIQIYAKSIIIKIYANSLVCKKFPIVYNRYQFFLVL